MEHFKPIAGLDSGFANVCHSGLGLCFLGLGSSVGIGPGSCRQVALCIVRSLYCRCTSCLSHATYCAHMSFAQDIVRPKSDREAGKQPFANTEFDNRCIEPHACLISKTKERKS